MKIFYGFEFFSKLGIKEKKRIVSLLSGEIELHIQNYNLIKRAWKFYLGFFRGSLADAGCFWLVRG